MIINPIADLWIFYPLTNLICRLGSAGRTGGAEIEDCNIGEKRPTLLYGIDNQLNVGGRRDNSTAIKRPRAGSRVGTATMA